MATFLLTWNPKGWPDADYAEAVAATAAGRHLARRWGVGQRRSGINAGDRAFLVRLVQDRGIVGAGRFTGEVYADQHRDRVRHFAEVELELLLPLADRLPPHVLKARVPGVAWDHLQGSGILVRPPHDRALEELWTSHVLDA
ncbi:hypothetical protein [Asanoa iriomotensis]|uniref:Uncharacterized protein n=1 Tax=Asanoa iriomotensis TaxID=234613 RepID=A0ABQ4CAM8_9ACTN|nr:hypothetical protein [Asanoa iriomotensis]GIF59839.1 hypothetical protein Air01nite_59340 [Asanoa iriomotensis]